MTMGYENPAPPATVNNDAKRVPLMAEAQRRDIGAGARCNRLTRRSVLWALTEHQRSDEGAAYASTQTLADEAGVSERTVRRCLAEFEAEGLLKRTGRRGFNTVWCIDRAALEALPLTVRPREARSGGTVNSVRPVRKFGPPGPTESLQETHYAKHIPPYPQGGGSVNASLCFDESEQAQPTERGVSDGGYQVRSLSRFSTAISSCRWPIWTPSFSRSTLSSATTPRSAIQSRTMATLCNAMATQSARITCASLHDAKGCDAEDASSIRAGPSIRSRNYGRTGAPDLYPLTRNLILPQPEGFDGLLSLWRSRDLHHRGGQSAREPALRAYRRAIRRGGDPAHILSAAREFLASPTAKREGGRFMPKLARWLREGRWEGFACCAADAAEWERRLANWRYDRTWHHTWGPDPEKPSYSGPCAAHLGGAA